MGVHQRYNSCYDISLSSLLPSLQRARFLSEAVGYIYLANKSHKGKMTERDPDTILTEAIISSYINQLASNKNRKSGLLGSGLLAGSTCGRSALDFSLESERCLHAHNVPETEIPPDMRGASRQRVEWKWQQVDRHAWTLLNKVHLYLSRNHP